VDALAAAALELAGGAPRLPGLRPAAAALHGLVRLVLAVGVSVAAPQGRDALRVVAAELVLAAGGSRALVLVAAVAAVVVAVAREDRRHALAVAAREVFGGAGLGVCTDQWERGRKQLCFGFFKDKGLIFVYLFLGRH